MSLKPGIKGFAKQWSRLKTPRPPFGSGLVPVFSTPSMIALMENSAVNALIPHLSEGEGSVGTFLSVSHDAATPIGMKVWAECELTAVDGKALTFSVTAYDEKGVIGKGTHGRFIINVEKFLSKVAQKRESMR
jgi:predicted thioesterase